MIRNTSRRASIQPICRARINSPSKRCKSSSAVQNRPMKACIVGAGPAGFYSAYRLLSNQPDCTVDIFEALPVPYGLARFGVAPDHPEVKNVTHKFDEIASSERVGFYGNVRIGTDVAVRDLYKAYDCILFSHGATRHRQLGIKGEHLDGVLSARSFVGWYNGLPEAAGLRPRLDEAETAVVIGQGNVALDIARILLSNVDELRKTDIADHALEALSKSRIKRVDIVGRRGPLQASFTIKEIRELVNLQNTRFLNTSQAAYKNALSTGTLPKSQKRLIELLAKQEPQNVSNQIKSWDIHYALSPQQFNGTSQLESVTYEVNRLEEVGGQVKARGTGQVVTKEAQLAFSSIGYQSEPITGMEDIGVIFDTNKHIISNESGRVSSMDGFVLGVYCSGWAKVGPVGVIASTMRDAFETADLVTHDWFNGTLSVKQADINSEKLLDVLQKEKQIVTWPDWKRLEQYELENGAADSPARPMRKVIRIEDMLRIARDVPC